MGKEIERKYLVTDGWRDATDGPGTEMRQAYLSDRSPGNGEGQSGR